MEAHEEQLSGVQGAPDDIPAQLVMGLEAWKKRMASECAHIPLERIKQAVHRKLNAAEV